jgi:uroporphyrinogen decarboxylase
MIAASPSPPPGQEASATEAGGPSLRHRALVEHVLAGGPAAPCPAAFWQHHPVADQEAASLVEATLRFQERFDCDLVKITPASTFQLRDYGLTDAWRGDPLGRRSIGPGIVPSPDDWARLPRLDPEAGFGARYLACARQVRQRLNEEVPVLQTVFDPLFQVAALGGERFGEHLKEHPEAVAQGIEIVGHNTVLLIEALRQAGVDGIVLVCQHARRGAMDATTFRRFGRHPLRRCLEAAAALPINLLHLHGNHLHASEVLDLPVRVLHFAEDPANPRPEDLLATGRCGVSTGPDQQGWIWRGTAQQAADEVAAVLRRLKGPRFLLGAGCVLPLDTPEANIRAAMAEAHRPRPDRPAPER